MSDSNPSSSSDISSNDFLHFGVAFNTDSGITFYPLTPTAAIRGSTPTFPSPTYDPSQCDPSQYYPPSLTEASSGESSTSLASPGPSTHSSVPSNHFLTPAYLGSETDQAPPVASRKRKADHLDSDSESVPHKRQPNKKRPGTGYTDMMLRLPPSIQEVLKRDYPGCCDNVNKKDNSTLNKHRFSNGHYKQVPKDIQPFLPAYICPCFLALHPQCRSAKAGRYDSAERHCLECPGFQEMSQRIAIWPVEITKGEYEALLKFRQELRARKDPGPNEEPKPESEQIKAERQARAVLVVSVTTKLLKELVDGALEALPDSDFGDVPLTGGHGAGAVKKVKELGVDDGSDDEEPLF